jgi:hypothetical protein
MIKSLASSQQSYGSSSYAVNSMSIEHNEIKNKNPCVILEEEENDSS